MKKLKITFLYTLGLLKKVFIPTPSYLFTQIFFLILLVRLFIQNDNPWSRYCSLNDIERSMSVDTLIVTTSDFKSHADLVGKVIIKGYLKNDSRKKRGVHYNSANGNNQFEIEQRIIDSTFYKGIKAPIILILKHKSDKIKYIYPINDKAYLKSAKRGLIGEIIIFLIIVPFHFFLRVILFTIKFIKNVQ